MEKTETLTIPIDAETLKVLAEEAERQGTTPVAVLRELVQEKFFADTVQRKSETAKVARRTLDELDAISERQRERGFGQGTTVQPLLDGESERARLLDALTLEERKQVALQALADLRAYRESLPESAEVDVGELIREGREELDKRIPI